MGGLTSLPSLRACRVLVRVYSFCYIMLPLNQQAGDGPFNRGILLNIGYKEALKFDQYECFIFHDVDFIPEDDRNDYSCPTSPRHLIAGYDKYYYRRVSCYSLVIGVPCKEARVRKAASVGNLD